MVIFLPESQQNYTEKTDLSKNFSQKDLPGCEKSPQK
jgi:hypothetical protein